MNITSIILLIIFRRTCFYYNCLHNKILNIWKWKKKITFFWRRVFAAAEVAHPQPLWIWPWAISWSRSAFNATKHSNQCTQPIQIAKQKWDPPFHRKMIEKPKMKFKVKVHIDMRLYFSVRNICSNGSRLTSTSRSVMKVLPNGLIWIDWKCWHRKSNNYVRRTLVWSRKLCLHLILYATWDIGYFQSELIFLAFGLVFLFNENHSCLLKITFNIDCSMKDLLSSNAEDKSL